MKYIIPILLVLIVGISGCIQAQPPEGAETGGGAQQPADKELTTTISPARDLTGRWEGNIKWRDNVGNPACSYKGTIVLNFQQTGNNLAGTWQATITDFTQYLSVPCNPTGPTPVNNLQGTVSSSTFEFTTGLPEITFDGSFTSDLMRANFESCPGQCPGGTVGVIGDFSATRRA